jgi:hypothetical protein
MMQRHPSIWTWLLTASTVLVLGLAAEQAAQAQGPKPWEILVAYGPITKPTAAARIALRPNVVQPVFIYLKNTGPLPKKNLDMMLVRVDSPGKIRVLANGKVEKVAANQTELVKFKPLPAPAPPKNGNPPAAPAAVNEVPPFQFQLWVAEGGKDAVKLDLPVTIQQPSEYVQVAPPVFDKKRNRLSARVEVNEDSADPPCPVELVLDATMIPGLIRPKVGLFKEQLGLKNREADLFADNLQFVQGLPPKNGRIALTIDGYERAYQFKTTFDQGTSRQLGDQARARLKAPHYFNPEEKVGPKGEKIVPQLILHLEADGVVEDAKLEVAFDRAGDGRFGKPQLFSGLRDQSLSVAAVEEGNLAFRTRVRDWTMELDTTGVLGKRLVRLRILGTGDTPVALADEQNQKDEALVLFSKAPGLPYAPLSFDAVNKAVYAEIVVDATPPDGVRLVELPAKAAPGEKLVLKATAKKRSELEQAPISKVFFSVGENPKEPPTPGLFNKQTQLWQAEVLVPADAKDKLPVGVQFVTATGLAAANTGAIPVQVGGALDNSKITGVVTWDAKLQPGRPVQLRDAKGKVLANAKSDAKGVYVFPNVQPGSYRVVAAVPGNLAGAAPATVTKDKGETIKADISLKRVP